MTIKKPMKAPSDLAAPASGGAAIASRLRLDAPDPKARTSVSTTGAKVALGAAAVSLLVTGVLVYMLWRHWEFLMPA